MRFFEVILGWVRVGRREQKKTNKRNKEKKSWSYPGACPILRRLPARRLCSRDAEKGEGWGRRVGWRTRCTAHCLEQGDPGGLPQTPGQLACLLHQHIYGDD